MLVSAGIRRELVMRRTALLLAPIVLVAVLTLGFATAPRAAAASAGVNLCPLTVGQGSTYYRGAYTAVAWTRFAVACTLSNAIAVTAAEDLQGHTLFSVSHTVYSLARYYLSPTYWLTYSTTRPRTVFFYLTIYERGIKLMKFSIGLFRLPCCP
jgi:hypothetical protein